MLISNESPQSAAESTSTSTARVGSTHRCRPYHPPRCHLSCLAVVTQARLRRTRHMSWFIRTRRRRCNRRRRFSDLLRLLLQLRPRPTHPSHPSSTCTANSDGDDRQPWHTGCQRCSRRLHATPPVFRTPPKSRCFRRSPARRQWEDNRNPASTDGDKIPGQLQISNTPSSTLLYMSEFGHTSR